MHSLGIIVALAIALSLYVGMNYYCYRRLRPVVALPARYLAISMALLAGSLFVAEALLHSGIGAGARPLAWLASLWLGFVFMFFTFHIGADLIRYMIGRYFPAQITRRRVTLAVTVAVLLAGAHGLYSARQISVVPITIDSAKVSVPLTIVQISDLHLGVMSERRQVRHLVARINALQPDIIVSTGDLVDMALDHLDGFAAELSRLRAPLGKFAVSGNHEALAGIEKATAFTRQAGFRVLSNEGVTLAGLNIVAVSDPAVAGRDGKGLPDERSLLHPCTSGFTLLLKHRPQVSADTNFDLQLSGHTHGGQIFPFGLLTALVYRHWPGLSRIDARRWLYLSRGTGTWGPPLRVAAPAEVTLIHLRPE